MDEKEQHIENAKIAEQAERYDDMVEAMRTVVTLAKGDLKDEERNLLSVAYKNVVGARRSAWRIIKSVEEKEEKANEEMKRELARKYREKIEKELDDKCKDVLNLIDEHLYPSAERSQSQNAAEAKVFYLKMKGDYYRYQVEIHPKTDSQFEELKEKSKEAYKKAKCEGENLKATHPIKLGLALNFSVFYYEIAENPDEACKEAQTAFDDAISELDHIEENTYKDSTLIMQLLRDNLTLWKQDREAEKDSDDGE